MANAVGKFNQSGPFRAFLETFFIDYGYHGGDDADLVLYCKKCGVGPGLGICNVEDGDTMDVLIETVIQHDCA